MFHIENWKEWNFVISSNFNLELVLFTSISPLSLPLRFGKIPKLFYFIWYMKDFFLSMICEKSDGRQFHQYQQSKQSPLNLNWTRLTKKRPRNPVSDLYIWSLHVIIYNYSLLLRSIRVFMDLKNDIHRSLYAEMNIDF
jgi:hypothetical protein